MSDETGRPEMKTLPNLQDTPPFDLKIIHSATLTPCTAIPKRPGVVLRFMQIWRNGIVLTMKWSLMKLWCIQDPCLKKSSPIDSTFIFWLQMSSQSHSTHFWYLNTKLLWYWYRKLPYYWQTNNIFSRYWFIDMAWFSSCEATGAQKWSIDSECVPPSGCL